MNTADDGVGRSPPADADSDPEDEPDVDDLLDDLERLEDRVDPEDRERVRQTMRTARRLRDRGPFGTVISGFDRRDAAEAFVGSLVFGIPMLVEGGTQEVGAFLATRPVPLAGTLVGTVGVVAGLLFVADVQQVRVEDPLLGVVPRRLAGVLAVSAVTATTTMTGWGRVDWSEPWVATGQISVCFVAMALGAALGDILPGS
ncbi:MAG: DUF2391 domain-containing protein [Halolamina sp.]